MTPDLRQEASREDRPLVDLLLERLENLILEGNLKAGNRLKEKSLAAQWDVSRGPIREACRILQEAGLVEVVPNRGVIVRRVNLQDVLHEYDVRAALWRLGGREAARNLSHRQMDGLDRLIAKMDAAIGANDSDAYFRLNTQFHDAIASATGNRPFIVLQRRLVLQSRLFRRQSPATETGFPERNDDHRLMLEAFRKGDAETAGALSEEHVLRGKARFIASLEKAGALPANHDSLS